MPVSWFVSKSLCKRKISIIFRRVRSQIDSTEVVSHGRNGRETRKLDWKGSTERVAGNGTSKKKMRR